MTSRRTRRRSAQANATIVARALLTKAAKLGIHVDLAGGGELILIMPLRVPRETRRWFFHWIDEFRNEILAIVQAENAERVS